jgi:N-methylhydantoinase A/oxoprolinase/acetone carboxylase beta subunit
VKELDTSGLESIVESFRSRGVEAIAVCMIGSYVDSSHEERIAEELRTLCPEI